MATQIKFRRDTRTNLLLSTPVEGEIGVDTTNDRLILGDGSTSGGIPIASFVDIQNNRFNAVDAVGTDTITLTFDDAPTAYAEYQTFTFKPAANNTGAVTININSLGAKDLKKVDASGSLVDVEADDLILNIPVNIIYDGTRFILNQGGGAGGLKLISTTTISGAPTSIAFTDLAADTNYLFVFDGVTGSNVSSSIVGQLSIDNGSSYIGTAGAYNNGISGSGGSSTAAQTFMNISGATIGSVAGVGYTGNFYLINPNDSGQETRSHAIGGGNNNSAIFVSQTHSGRTNAEANDAIQFLPNVGTFIAGQIQLYSF